MESKILERYGIRNSGVVYRNLPTPALYAESVRNREGFIAHLGPYVVRTGHHTGRSPKDRFIVRESTSEGKVWWGKENRPFDGKKFDILYYRILAYLQGKQLYVQDCYSGADPDYRMAVRVINETAWHNLFVRNMFIRMASRDELDGFEPEFTVIHIPNFHANPELDGTNSESFVILNFEKRLVIIGGTAYAGEIKKAIFTVQNYYLPQKNVLSMHCSANMGEKGDTAIFFGLSGTGKTTLSTDPDRKLIGDDEHGWSEKGIFNLEGGCYAKVIRLSQEGEPDIYECTRKFGTVLENVAIDIDTRRIDLNDSSLAENTRAAYPITHIKNSAPDGLGGNPSHIILLTADAFGVLPPVTRLTPEVTQKYFLIGYTAKVAGTEIGITEPKATFSSCFGSPFMALEPTVYAHLLRDKIKKHKVSCWLVNTGWVNGPYGIGKRISIAHTRAIIKAILEGTLEKSEYWKDDIFGLEIPKTCPGVPAELLNPALGWADKDKYKTEARKLAEMFENVYLEFKKDEATEKITEMN
ncbi:MAG: phosphoenolpyruvate carboxykinase (ATP) [candidate division Zixibacteria bacterium HGW-Zixibacteria-1]|nr:MAG: phosphoenolpyruvate carboxykinase (ATP) [candidate division Zixibacteria bacterium HGW-Zixibacteria-1]